MPKLNVAIVGAGLGGLTLGIALRKFAPDVHFEIYEAASELTEVGAGISMRGRSWYIMQSLGVDTILLPIAGGGATRTLPLHFRKSDQAEGWEADNMGPTETRYSFHRAEVQKVLVEHLQETHPIHLHKRLESYVQPADAAAPIELRFQDGTTATCDILVGADGVRSAVRSVMYSQLADAALAAGKTEEEAARLRAHGAAVFSGYIAYRTLIRKDTLSKEDAAQRALNRDAIVIAFTQYCGKDRNLVTYPISQGQIVNVAALVSHPDREGTVYDGPWTSSVSKEEITDRYQGWEPDAQVIVKMCLPLHMQHVQGGLKWVINVVKDLPTFVDGRVALLGDAAHSMMPSQGAGAGQGFEDVYILAQFLSRADITKANAATALKVYDEIRRPFSQKVAALSYLTAKTNHFSSPEYAHMTEEQSASGTMMTREQLWELVAKIKAQGEWHDESTVAEDKEAAFRVLDEALKKA
ncbi:FAD/NAD(P)-binding domain-containing protein [Daedaleopsis nitida]|nr:FAD/NAD(P)-binding domain-containing protein [Daedaleopsis nitida]